MTTVKYCNIDSIGDAAFAAGLQLLPVDMKEEILRYRFLCDQKTRLLSRLMLLESLQETFMGQYICEWKRDINNKPVIDNWYAFNITHSSKIVVFTYSACHVVGIDIEEKVIIDYKGIGKYFHLEEEAFIDNLNYPIHEFYRIWVKKEAILKAHGTGIVNGLNHFSCLENTVTYEGLTWYLREINLDPAYVCYLCLPDAAEEINVQEFKFKSIN